MPTARVDLLPSVRVRNEQISLRCVVSERHTGALVGSSKGQRSVGLMGKQGSRNGRSSKVLCGLIKVLVWGTVLALNTPSRWGKRLLPQQPSVAANTYARLLHLFLALSGDVYLPNV